MSTIRLLPFGSHDGPTNMALDEVLLEAAAAGTASLRFYTWSEATLSLGYFQTEVVRRSDPLLADLPFVRRQTGGATLVHHHELTYALAFPQGSPWQPRSQSWICRMHRIIGNALAAFGASMQPQSCKVEKKLHTVLCFLHHTPGDLIINAQKIAGSAQRKQRGALLQHGAILLAQSEFTPALPGLRELTGLAVSPDVVQAVVQSAFLAETGWKLEETNWSPGEQARAQEIVREKYATDQWNCKR
jgi:lipoate-protein ligase A